MYVSFSAGSVMAGLSVEINVDKIQPVLAAGGTRKKDGFKIVPYAVRPHCARDQSVRAHPEGATFETKIARREVKDDEGNIVSHCPVLYLKDGEACLFVGSTQLMLPNPNGKDKIDKLLKTKQPAHSPELMLWMQLAEGITSVDALHAFFTKRQPTIAGKPPIIIQEAIRVVNDNRLKAFKRSVEFNIRPELAANTQGDTLLFHGCSPDAATNIQAEGLLMKFVGKHGRLLGVGLYGAPDPRKSISYCGPPSAIGRFLFVCRFNLAGASHGKPDGTYHEYATFDEAKVVVLWMIKLSG